MCKNIQNGLGTIKPDFWYLRANYAMLADCTLLKCCNYGDGSVRKNMADEQEFLSAELRKVRQRHDSTHKDHQAHRSHHVVTTNWTFFFFFTSKHVAHAAVESESHN